jgi:hypothetical protein
MHLDNKNTSEDHTFRRAQNDKEKVQVAGMHWLFMSVKSQVHTHQ